MAFKFRNGAKVRSIVTGFTGTVTARTDYLSGCARYYVEPPVDKDGNHRDGHSFDENELEEIKEEKPKEIKQSEPPTGGPRPMAKRCELNRRN